MMDDERITIADVRAAGLCCTGCKTWFQLRNLDFRKFLKEGIAVSELEPFNDALVDRILAEKRSRNSSNG